MDFNDAVRDIYQRYNGALNTSDVRNMLDDEIQHEQARLKALRPRGRGHYQEAVITAHRRILDWIASADEYAVDDLASFVASSRRACVWAVLIGKRINAAGGSK